MDEGKRSKYNDQGPVGASVAAIRIGCAHRKHARRRAEHTDDVVLVLDYSYSDADGQSRRGEGDVYYAEQLAQAVSATQTVCSTRGTYQRDVCVREHVDPRPLLPPLPPAALLGVVVAAVGQLLRLLIPRDRLLPRRPRRPRYVPSRRPRLGERDRRGGHRRRQV